MSKEAVGDSIDLKAIFGKLLKVWWLFVITVGLAVAAAYAKYKTTPKSYLVGASIMLSEKSRSAFGSSNEEFLKGTGYLRNSADIEDQIAVLRSQTMLRKTLANLKDKPFGISYLSKKNYLTRELYDYPPFTVVLDSSVKQVTGLPVHVKVDQAGKKFTVKVKGKNVPLYDPKTGTGVDDFRAVMDWEKHYSFGDTIREDNLAFSISFADNYPYDPKADYFFFINSLEGLVDSYGQRLGTESMGEKSNIVVLSIVGEAITKEKDFLNTLMATYIKHEQDKQNFKGERTVKFIEKQLDASSAQLDAAKSAMVSAETAAGGTGSSDALLTALVGQRADLENRLNRINIQIDYLNRIVSTMSNPDANNVASSADVDDASFASLIEQYNRDVTDLVQKLAIDKTGTAPPTIALKRKVRNIREQIVGSANNLLARMQFEKNSVSAQLSSVRGTIYSRPGAAAEAEAERSKYKLNESINNYLMEKMFEARIAINSDQVDKTVVDYARAAVGGPVAPDKKTLFGGALLLGLFIPIAFVLVRDFLNDTISDQDELKRLSPIPLLATIPESKRKRITPDEPKSLLAEAFRTARINLQYLNADAARQVVGFTSSSSGEGKTFCALNLATVMALSGKRTIIIDADMRRPRVQESLELQDGPGLSNYLIGETALDHIIRRTDINGLDVITAGPIPPNPLELVESSNMMELFKQLRNRYDQVIVDASPMGLVSEFVILTRHIDVTLYVVRQGKTHRKDLRLVNEMYSAGKLGRIDLLFNDVDKSGTSGYGYYVK